MYRHSERPVRKCGMCKLNFKTRCGLFDNPHAMWAGHRKCPGHMSEQHYERYLAMLEKHEVEQRSKPTAVKRRQVAKLRHTEPHHDGTRMNRT